ncbi:hypothetical protein ACFOWE_08085 [Planomonospora corallina]|uniref:PepSY domain-containing protein n=1 Tax=Planomonospora corallina TaxID=1806052 RepID=A0ABV8I242_9ACTN
MINKTVRRLIAVGAVAPAIALGAAGAAGATAVPAAPPVPAAPAASAADGGDGALWERTQAQANALGATLKVVRAYTDGSGKVLFEELIFTADRNGATIHRTTSGAGL